MENAAVTKGSTVEVSIDEPGFHGAWYVATVVERLQSPPTRKTGSNNNKKKKIRYLVEYHTLVQEGSVDEALTEVVDPSSVRPLPPCNLRSDIDGAAAESGGDGGGGEFEMYDVIDAYQRGGWWIGVVKKVIVEGGIRKYVVSFENPPEEVEFGSSRLRRHVDWIDRRWQLPLKKKTPEEELVDRNATHASDDAHSGFTTPAKGALLTDADNLTVDPQISAKKKSRLRKHTESKSEMVGALDASAPSSKRNKRVMNPVEEDSRGKRFQSSAGSKGKTKVMAPVVEKRSYAIHQKSPLMEHEMTTTERKRGRRPKLLAKRRTSTLEGGQEITTDAGQPLSPPSVSSYRCAESLDQAVGTTDYQQDWPFIKRSPAWAAIVPLELHQTPPQRPHFSPLKNTKEDLREGTAIAMIVIFWNLVQRVSDLQLSDPIDIINSKLETLADLETHGFDVGALRGRLNELLSLKSKVGQHEDKLKKVREEIEKINGEMCLEEKEINELEVQMKELQEKMAKVVTMKKMKEEEIKRLQSNLVLVSQQISDWEFAFKKLVATPLICK